MSEQIHNEAHENTAEELAQQAMAELMADSTKALTEYLRKHAARLDFERALEEIARDEWAAWKALTSEKKGGFSEAQLRRQGIMPPAPMPRRDRGKSRPKKAAAKPAAAPATQAQETTHTDQQPSSHTFGG